MPSRVEVEFASAQLELAATDPATLVEQADTDQRLLTLLDSGVIPEREVAVLRMRYRDGKTLEEIAQALGVSVARVRQIEQRGRHRLLEVAAEQGLIDSPPLFGGAWRRAQTLAMARLHRDGDN